MKQPKSLILASGSPRRQQILKEAGIIFSIKVKNTPEDYPTSLPLSEVPSYLAEKKAFPFLEELQNEVVITADTVVLINNKILGKPLNFENAFQMLSELSGQKHQVITGVCILSKSKKVIFSDITDVYFKRISEAEITYYLNKCEPYDKAGAYGIQEWIGYIGIEKIVGSFYNVMGLPIHKVVESLSEF